MSSTADSEGGFDNEATKASSENGSEERCNSSSSNGSDYGSSYGSEECSDANESDHEYGSQAGSEDESEDGSESQVEYDSENEGGRVAPMKSLLQLAQEAVLKSLSKAVDGKRVTARYCCGGGIPAVRPHLTIPKSEDEAPINDGKEGNIGGKAEAEEEVEVMKAWKDGDVLAGSGTSETPDLTIRWDSGSMTRRLTVASGDPLGRNSPLGRLHLIKACGSEGLDQSKFTVNFHPQDHGILHAISQILLPGWKNTFLSNFPEHRGVQVDGCRLHVSTVDVVSDVQPGNHNRLLGQLIVSLPSSFEGGELTILSDGHESVFDWRPSEIPGLHWAAFTNDCNFELAEVTKGTQILLVYDLVVTNRVGDGALSGIDPKLLPLYEGVRDMLLEPEFMKTGGTLGYYCRYPYSHTNSRMSNHLPRALRGVDMVLYTVFKSLGLDVQVQPILDPSDLHKIDDRQLERFGFFDEEEYRGWMEERCCCKRSKVGNAFHELRIGDYLSPFNEDYDLGFGFDENLAFHWPMEERLGVTWLNTPSSGGKKPRELAVVMEEDRSEDMCYCPDCGQGHYFERVHSLVGMLVTVPKMADRNLDV